MSKDGNSSKSKKAGGSPGADDGATRDARALLRKESFGTLCTAHSKHDGWPFGSIVPYAVLPEGDPVVWLSEIAEHTRNVAAEPRVSLFVADSSAHDDPQAGARVTLLAKAERAEGATAKAAADAYFTRFPASKAMESAHGFFFFVLRVATVRWIAGFGSMGWLSRDQWAPKAAPLAADAKAICDHMNRDHAAALAEIVAHVEGVQALTGRMTSVDANGFDVEVLPKGGHEPHSVRVAFAKPVTTPDEVRRAMIAMLGEARKGRS